MATNKEILSKGIKYLLFALREISMAVNNVHLKMNLKVKGKRILIWESFLMT